MGEGRKRAGAGDKLRQAWEKLDDARFEVSYRLDQVMRHPVASKVVEFGLRTLVERLGTTALDAQDRRRRARFQASLPPDSPWKVQPDPRSGSTGE